MTERSASRDDEVVPESAVQQPVPQRAQAAAADRHSSTEPVLEDDRIQKADPIASNTADSDIPPPTYGEVYGEIHNEKDGLGTSARVTDDGRVNIHINQINRRLSQIFTPALRQQIQSVQESRPPPPPYIPTSLGGEEGSVPPPRLNVVIQVVGSRGDVQPFIALGKFLKDTYGHRVRLATHPNFKDFVQENGLEFFSIGGDPSRLMAFMVQNPSLMPGFRSLRSGDIGQRRKDVAEYIQGCWRSCYEAGDGMDLRATVDELSESSDNATSTKVAVKPFVADCIIANPPSFAHIHCAERLGVPLHIMFTMPYSPTQAFPHPLANIQSSNADPQLTNYLSYVMIELLSWQGLGDVINRFRAKCLGLDPVSLIWAPGMLQRLRIPHTYCWSPALIPKPKDWGPHISISGFCFLDSATGYTPAPDLQTFLDTGPPPVYIGFGSIVLEDPDAMTELIFETARKIDRRVLLSKGWGGIGTDSSATPDSVFILDNVPHDWLFDHVSCVVHHGGAGTTAAGIAAGRPTVVVPFFGDQSFWGAMVARAGAGPDPIPHKQLTADNLAEAINFCLKPESLERAERLASKVAEERGSDMGAQSFHQYLEADRLRCTLAPSRPAVWRVKRTQIRLSAFAACTLANANLLDFHDLKLFRSQEYNTDEGPWDPISGGAAACYRAFSGMAMGLAEVPSETLKTLHISTGPNRRPSQESLPKTVRNRKTQQVGDRRVLPTLPAQGQTTTNEQKSLAQVQSPPNSSSLSLFTSDMGLSSVDAVRQGQPGSEQDSPSSSRVRSWNDSSTGKDRDMLSQTSAHSSKGLGRFAKAFVEIPMEVSVGLTKGFHNMPKIWGDDTVRPQEKVHDFKSGAVAAGKEFGYGWYDGVTGLVTQPWKGAQNEGASGFVKGIGRGLAGFATKPLAGFSGILGHTMKGMQKEMQKLFGRNVQNYIVASRVAQGYEEWLRSSDSEKQDVVVQWRLVQKRLKKNQNPSDTMEDIMEARQSQSTGLGRFASANSAPSLQIRSAIHSTSSLPFSESPPEAASISATNQVPLGEMSHRDLEEDLEMEWATQKTISRLEHHSREIAADEVDQENLRQAMLASEAEARQHESEALEFKDQLVRAMAQSMWEQ